MKASCEVVQDWVAAYNRQDAYSAAELYHEDATNLQVALGDPTAGRQAMLDDLLSFFHAFPDNFTRIESLPSRKRLVKHFRDEVGQTPKLFSRIRRLQEALRIIESGRLFDWAELALMCGYFDQAPLIHEFSSLIPGSYLACRGEHPNHVVLGY